LSVNIKVEAVKDVMLSSVTKALTSVEALEQMDEKAELFEDQSKKFHKRSVEVKVQEKSKYRWIICMLVMLVLVVLGYFIVPAILAYKSVRDGGGGGGDGDGGDRTRRCEGKGGMGGDETTGGVRMIHADGILLSCCALFVRHLHHCLDDRVHSRV
jgi:hypothetical protein